MVEEGQGDREVAGLGEDVGSAGADMVGAEPGLEQINIHFGSL